ncbi:uncharacterized protein IL334_003758 [Kwoniella shivajii]|uniref:Alcohol acetyltransferase n=1 Tax=Kwoniella shivajii TaxID=564305 RepID=A0ABZ1CYS9_9TREE|nr:hypothetical protein IL334_003758 [Kwoniella shivajii]
MTVFDHLFLSHIINNVSRNAKARWSHARCSISSPIIVIYHASLPSGIVNLDDIKASACPLCETYPILLYGVEHSNISPSYSKTILSDPRDLVREAQTDDSLSKLVERTVQRGKEFVLATGPLFELQLHHKESHDRLVLLIDHTLCDGLGARNLFADWLNLLSGIPLPTQPEGLPARMDDTVSLHPLVPTNWNILSSYLSPIVKLFESPSPPHYPPKPSADYDSVTAKQQFSEFEIPQSDLSGLLAISKDHKVPTIHPVIHVASLFALYRASTWSNTGFYSSVPISERNEKLGHPRSTGNYVTFHFSTDHIEPSTMFWEHARSFSNTLRQPTTKSAARQALAKLGQLEVPWEDYLKEVMNDSNGPHKLSLAVSNVGVMELPQTGKLAGLVQDVYFTQSASAMGAAAVVSIMSTRGGSMSVSISSKIGSLPPGIFETFTVQLKSLLQAVARGDVKESMSSTDSIPGVPDI